MLFLGFSAGLPLLLVFGTLSAWLARSGVDKSTIGFISWVALFYGFKVLWSPLVDRLKLPILGLWLGQRRSWMLVSQIGVISGLLLMSLSNPQIQLLEHFYRIRKVSANAVRVSIKHYTIW